MSEQSIMASCGVHKQVSGRMKILVFTTVFPNSMQPNLGVFVRERMFNVAKHCEIKVIAPVPWFPLINLIKKNYRPNIPSFEFQDGIEVYHPKFFSIPKCFKFIDGPLLFLSSVLTVSKIQKYFDFDVVDAHFLYPDAVGASYLAYYFGKPLVVTGRESDLFKFTRHFLHRIQMVLALTKAAKIITVSSSLKNDVEELGISEQKIRVVGNGIDLRKFTRIPKLPARQEIDLPVSARVIISVGWLIERKGFHRIIRALPKVIREFPDVRFVIVGGAPGSDSYEAQLRALVVELSLQNYVIFAGPQPHERLKYWLSAADIFCLATSGEGWANVFLEAMACGLPVVTTKVGGNPEVVASEDVGILYDLDDEQGLVDALLLALRKEWDRERIVAYAQNNSWDSRVEILFKEFEAIVGR